MMEYSNKVMQNFLHPKNIGKIEDADGIGKVGNSVCGDILNIYINVGKRKNKKKGKEIEYIKDIKFQTLGCGAAIAVSSMITQLAKGKTLDEAEKISNKDIVDSLGDLPKIKYHCSLLGADALHLAIKDYKKKKRGKYDKN